MRRALQTILVISLVGVAFSGTLVYRELFQPAAVVDTSGRCTPIGAPGTILGYPPCVYGLVMYLALTIVSVAGLRAGRRAAA